MNYTSINPYTETVLNSFETLTDAQCEDALVLADSAQKIWQQKTVNERALLFFQLADVLKENHIQLAELASIEMGKNIAEAKLEVLKCVRGCLYYATHAPSLLATQWSMADTGKKVGLQYNPVGVVLGVFPWNFPYWQIIRSLVPILIAGNAMIFKPAPNVPQCALALVSLLKQVPFPTGLVQCVFITENQVAQIIKSEKVQAVTLTGSEKAGSAVAAVAASEIKKTVLELGGNDPFIVFEDANLDLATTQAITARFQNNGQSCIAAKRFIVHDAAFENFVALFIQKIQQLNMGNPLLENTQIGPIARKDLLQKIVAQVEKLQQSGSSIIHQNKNIPATGYFYPPTLIEVDAAVQFDEELFGPVATITRFKHQTEAIYIANNTQFGLGASVWSNNETLALEVANKLHCGQVFINEMVKSQPAFPFGGVKKSGYGRELGAHGLYEFCNLKTLWI